MRYQQRFSSSKSLTCEVEVMSRDWTGWSVGRILPWLVKVHNFWQQEKCSTIAAQTWM